MFELNVALLASVLKAMQILKYMYVKGGWDIVLGKL
jgi:hypothetical protein